MSELHSIRHGILVTLHTPGAYGQCSMFDHSGYKQPVVLGKIWDLVALVWPIRSRVISTSSALVKCWNFLGCPSVGSRGRDLCHVQLHPTWFEPTAECRSWAVASNLYSGHLPVGLYLGRESLLLVGPLFHFPQCHSGLVSSRNGRMCLCHSVTSIGIFNCW